MPMSPALVPHARDETGASSTSVVVVEGLAKVYGGPTDGVHALGPVDLAVASGEIVAVLGPSGCGKSTLLDIVAGLTPPTSGTVLINGTTPVGVPPEIGMMFQRAVLMPWRMVLDNVLLPLELSDGQRRAKEHRTRALELLDMVGVAEFAGRYPEELSGGMQQRVAICRMLIAEPSVLLLDEPFGSLDEITREHMNVELARICLLASATVFVTHSLQEAIFIADRVVVMTGRPGTICASLHVDIPRDARNLEVLSTAEFQAYVGQARQILHQGSQGRPTRREERAPC